MVSALDRSAAPVEGYAGEAVPGLTVKVESAAGEKCQRCWKYDEHVGEDGLCPRCRSVVDAEG